jgi:putative peptidoglycan lipid II flippase
VTLTSVLGYFAALYLPQMLGLDRRMGVVGLTATAGIAGWIEFFLLRRAISKRIGPTSVSASYTFKLWGAAIAGAAIAWGVKLGLASAPRLLAALLVLTAYGMAYLLITTLFGIREATDMTARLRRRRV